MADTSRREIAIRHLQFARSYTLQLLEDVDPAQWFQQPGGCVTHVGWQAAHLAMAEYGLALFRQRGRRPEDAQLMSARFRKQYGKGSTPDPDPRHNSDPAEIKDVLQRVHEQALREMAGYGEQQLDEPVDEPYAAFNTKFGALLFCADHEMIHAGQIGLLRRLLGKAPVR